MCTWCKYVLYCTHSIHKCMHVYLFICTEQYWNLIFLLYLNGYYIYNLYILKPNQIVSNNAIIKQHVRGRARANQWGKVFYTEASKEWDQSGDLWNFKGRKEEKTQRSKSCELWMICAEQIVHHCVFSQLESRKKIVDKLKEGVEVLVYEAWASKLWNVSSPCAEFKDKGISLIVPSLEINLFLF